MGIGVGTETPLTSGSTTSLRCTAHPPGQPSKSLNNCRSLAPGFGQHLCELSLVESRQANKHGGVPLVVRCLEEGIRSDAIKTSFSSRATMTTMTSSSFKRRTTCPAP